MGHDIKGGIEGVAGGVVVDRRGKKADRLGKGDVARKAVGIACEPGKLRDPQVLVEGYAANHSPYRVRAASRLRTIVGTLWGVRGSK